MKFSWKINPFLKQLSQRYFLVLLLANMVLFWTVFDSINQYVTPIYASQNGFPDALIGVLLALSSVAGGIFDFVISRYAKDMKFTKLFTFMFMICVTYPFILWFSKTVWPFLFAMVIWGLYFNLYGYGSFDLISRYTKKRYHASGFGILQAVRSIGGIIAPLSVVLIVGEWSDWKPLAVGGASLIIALLFFFMLFMSTKVVGEAALPEKEPRQRSFFLELSLWRKIGAVMASPLVLTFLYFTIEALVWTLVPLYAELLNNSLLGGLLITAYTLPAVLIGWIVGRITGRFGKKKTAFIGLLIGSLILSAFPLVAGNEYLMIVLIFFASLFISVSLPSINGAYADYISESPRVEGEIETMEDFSFNMGYVVGPLIAGIMAGVVGIAMSFSFMGIIGFIAAILLLIFTPKKININVSKKDLALRS